MENEASIKILLVDDHKIVRDGIRSLLSDVSGFEFIGDAENGLEAIEKADGLIPDLIILDINMPVMDGITCARKITEKHPGMKILALTMLNEQEHIKNMIASGALGYILKNSGKDELVKAIQTVMEGKNYFSNDVKDAIFMQMIGKKTSTGKIIGEPIPLTRREKDVLQLIVEEYTNQEIADKLFISVRTVDAHRRNLLEKTGARNTAGLVKFAIERQMFNNNHNN